jgi:hypothetical protein
MKLMWNSQEASCCLTLYTAGIMHLFQPIAGITHSALERKIQKSGAKTQDKGPTTRETKDCRTFGLYCIGRSTPQNGLIKENLSALTRTNRRGFRRHNPDQLYRTSTPQPGPTRKRPLLRASHPGILWCCANLYLIYLFIIYLFISSQTILHYSC